MTLHALLEDFGPPGGQPVSRDGEPPSPGGLPEEERLAAFEKGYGEGYEDATRAADEERRRVGLALAGRLEDLSFTFHEARGAVLREVRELLAAVADGLVPEMARGAFGGALVEAIEAELESRAECPVAVSVAPDAVEVVAPLMPEVPGFPVSLRGDPDLGEGQAVIGFPDGEREFDTAAVVERAQAALRDWLEAAAPRSSGRSGATGPGPSHEEADGNGAEMEAAHG